MYQEAETELIVRYAETDQMGIVHHANYPVWFEMGRTEFLKKIGFPYSKIEEKGIWMPITDMSCRFKKPARYEDAVVIKTRISRLTHVRVGFCYEICHKESGELLVSGETNHGCTGRDLKPVDMEAIWPELFHVLQLYYQPGKSPG